ncbi:HlyD family secretion protein [Desulfobaculum bizertense]|uniref:Membrane fusion protein, multidrug efflux system n=1 Tax=Desulfobaculum bizertense DSM 18034 TaxID=1121442 RepID=A0A1T4WCP8_9BACT|nr:HlyD family secretion protein [Desulfobaculum bizertense]SKA74967.1 membrane fusion protein, multidrug efflux system [Desulfobaculum bizertense DSM 18034]
MADEQNGTEKHAGLKRKIFAGLLVLMAVAALVWFLFMRGKVQTDDAFVDGHIYMISPRVSGYVTDVLVEDNQFVKKGESLLLLDETDYTVALAEARAALASLELGVPLERSQTGYKVQSATAAKVSLERKLEELAKRRESALHSFESAKSTHIKAAKDLRRYRTLVKDDVAPQSQLDDAVMAERTSQAAQSRAESEVAAVEREIAATKADLKRLAANIDLAATGEGLAEIKSREVEAQMARVHKAELNLKYCDVKAPVDGYVTKKNVEAGRVVASGQPVLAVVPLAPEDLWITANYKETQLEDVRVGQHVTIKVDTYSDVTLEGVVESIMAGTGSAFSLFPPENASGNYVKVVQRIPVRIRLTKTEGIPPLRIGMSVVPTIHTNGGDDE